MKKRRVVMVLKNNRQSIKSGDNSINIQAVGDININTISSAKFIDPVIKEEVDILRKSRFYIEFDRVGSTLTLGNRLVDGDLSGGSDAVRSHALSWCARLLSSTDDSYRIEEYLNFAKSLEACLEINIASAFIISQKGDKSAALSILANIDTPASRTASFMIVLYHQDGMEALDWFKNTGLETTDLDAEGKFSLLSQLLQLGRWDEAKESLSMINDHDLEDAPVLYHIVAITQLLSTVPTEFRPVVLSQVPFNAASFPLASDEISMKSRKTAQQHFSKATVLANQLNCPGAAAVDEEYALWLKLTDPENSDNGRLRLVERLDDTKPALHLVPLGLQFGIKLDIASVEQQIEQKIALHGRITQDAAIARFALAFTQKTPEDVALYIARHFDELSKHINKKLMQFLQIEMLAQAGLPGRANECLELLLEEGLSEADENRLKRVISEAEGTDPVEARITQFDHSDSLNDLETLVDSLEKKEYWDDLCKYGELLFDRTHSVQDAELYAISLNNTHKYKQLVEFIEVNLDIVSQSNNLQLLYPLGLYHEGMLLRASFELGKLTVDLENPNYRSISISLAIAQGDWNSLSEIVAHEYSKRDKRSAQELMGAAQLALRINSPHAKDLVFAAAAKAHDDAPVLAAAYFLASSAGWEDEVQVIHWLHRVAELSEDDGPIQNVTLRDVLDLKPEWDRRESETWQLLGRGQIPLFIAAQSLNKSLIDLTLFPAYANPSIIDPRRRSLISAFSGKRLPVAFDLSEKSVGMDVSTLLTLSYLKLLDTALDAFDSIYIPHSTLVWLFDEKQKATFHQPSRIIEAHKLRDLLSRDILEKFVSSTIAESDLSMQVGDELALLISEAEKVRDNDDMQHIVVRSSPVHHLSSLMEKEADLISHASVMSSCLSVVEKLRSNGQITAEEKKRACAYLHLLEKPWPNQPEITDHAVLYLDSLAIAYFLHIGILEKLHTAGFRAVASPRAVLNANNLIDYEKTSEKVVNAIERIRSAVNGRIKSGRIKVDSRSSTYEPEYNTISDHPTVSVMDLAYHCDGIITDERFLNQSTFGNADGARSQIYTTLDLLDALAAAKLLSNTNLFEYRTMLRQAGFCFIPVTDHELNTHLNTSIVQDNNVIETVELRAIRENILRIRMSDWLQLPMELPWLDSTFKVFIRVLKSLWKDATDLSEVKARSKWILKLINLRGWAHSFGAQNRETVVEVVFSKYLWNLLQPLTELEHDIKNEYCNWIEKSILVPIKEEYPELYVLIVEMQKEFIEKVVEISLKKVAAT